MRGARQVLLGMSFVAFVAMSAPAPVQGGFLTFAGGDPGVGPGAASPQTSAAISSFMASATTLGKTAITDFESAPLGNFSSLQVDSNVKVTLTNTDQNTPVGFNFGITKGADPSMYGASDILKLGFNTTPGGSQFLAFAPELNSGTASARFDFTMATNAFGVSLTGLGTSTGDLHLVFNDGANHDVAIAGQARGGIQFIGITDTAAIQSLSLEMRNVTGPSRDVFGIDDVRYTTTPSGVKPAPEPSTFVLACVGGIGLIWVYRRRLGSSA
jgi:hypothetical protein